ncbi:hypothetical protein Cni_G28497 [Canna indica]|uniref:Uncharacterized protein n=1 Tax=Canna indica TaxID=4628 RepID=A0AAQ3QT62_9LILI|nr:hypothetical protein Cni_G28497 [Canna indica]
MSGENRRRETLLHDENPTSILLINTSMYYISFSPCLGHAPALSHSPSKCAGEKVVKTTSLSALPYHLLTKERGEIRERGKRRDIRERREIVARIVHERRESQADERGETSRGGAILVEGNEIKMESVNC